MDALGAKPQIDAAATVASSAAAPRGEAQFKRHLEAAEKIYAQFATATAGDKEQMYTELNAAYAEVSKATKSGVALSIRDISRVFFLVGRHFYGGDMVKASHFFKVSLLLQFNFKEPTRGELLPTKFAEDIFKSDTLEKLSEALSREAQGALAKLDTWILDQFKNGLNLSETVDIHFAIGTTFRWLGHCYQNIDSRNTATPDNIAYFKAIYGLAEILLKQLAEDRGLHIFKEANWELAELCYNTGRFMYGLEHPGDVKGITACVSKVFPYLKVEGDTPRARKIQAQIFNILAMEGSKSRTTNPNSQQVTGYLALTKSCFDQVSKAVELAEQDQDFDQFLKHMFIHNKAGFAVDSLERGAEIAKPEDIRQWISTAFRYGRNQGFNHFYYASFALTAARFEASQKENETALRCLKTADEICDKFPNSTAAIRQRIAELRQKLQPKDEALATAGNGKGSIVPLPVTAVDQPEPTPPKTDLATDHTVTRDWKEIAVAMLIVSAVSAVFIVLGVATGAPLLIASGTVSAMTGGLLLFRWHYHRDEGLNSSTHNAFAAAYPTALAVSAIAWTIFSTIPGAIFGVLGLLIAGGAIYKGETAPVAIRV